MRAPAQIDPRYEYYTPYVPPGEAEMKEDAIILNENRNEFKQQENDLIQQLENLPDIRRREQPVPERYHTSSSDASFLQHVIDEEQKYAEWDKNVNRQVDEMFLRYGNMPLDQLPKMSKYATYPKPVQEIAAEILLRHNVASGAEVLWDIAAGVVMHFLTHPDSPAELHQEEERFALAQKPHINKVKKIKKNIK